MSPESPETPWLSGFAGPQSHNLYIAAVPPPGLAERMHAEWKRTGAGGQFRALKLHMTVLGICRTHEVDPRLVDRLCRAIDPLTLPEFEVEFDRFLAFGRGPELPALVFAPSAPGRELAALASLLDRALPGRRSVRSRLTPHVTASYGPALPTMSLPEPIRWRVGEILLIDNWVRVPRYEHLARWPLKPVAAGKEASPPEQLRLFD